MAKSYEQLQRQIAELQAEAEELRQKELGEVIARIRTAIDHYGITAADLGFGSTSSRSARPDASTPARKKPGRKPGAKAASKTASTVLFRDESGRTWAGRGKRPQWLRDALLAGRTLEDFKVPQA